MVEYRAMLAAARRECGDTLLGDLAEAALLARRAHSAAWKAAETSRKGVWLYSGSEFIRNVRLSTGCFTGYALYVEHHASIISKIRVMKAADLYDGITRTRGELPRLGTEGRTYRYTLGRTE